MQTHTVALRWLGSGSTWHKWENKQWFKAWMKLGKIYVRLGQMKLNHGIYLENNVSEVLIEESIHLQKQQWGKCLCESVLKWLRSGLGGQVTKHWGWHKDGWRQRKGEGVERGKSERKNFRLIWTEAMLTVARKTFYNNLHLVASYSDQQKIFFISFHKCVAVTEVFNVICSLCLFN